ncbi:metallophosphoesterase [bacterium]|nr:metallophosphoesterase [bacterium]
MRKLPFLFLLPLLAGCSLFSGQKTTDSFEESSSASGSIADESSSSLDEASSSLEIASSESGVSEELSSSVMESRALDVYAINDFHGQVKEEDGYPGIEILGSYLKQKKEKEGALLISSGDMFQGSLESNYNRGHLLTDVMNAAHFDAFSLGNHEFDWGKQAIRDNKSRKGKDGYQTPFLSANLYDFTGTAPGKIQQSDLGGEYAVTIADNGLKVGIIGTIGSAQITSVSSQNVADLTFKDPVPIICSLSDKLRTEENCDVVIVSHHGPQSGLLGQNITSVSSVSNKRYVDLVLCAHTHTHENTFENGVLFTQNNDKGEDLSHVYLTVEPNGDVKAKLETIYPDSMKESEIDSEIHELVSSYAEATDPIGKEVLGTVRGSFGNKLEAPNLMAGAVLNEALDRGFEVDLAMVNVARKGLDSGTLTYSALFESFPFDNEIYILEASGSDIINEARHNYVARNREAAFSTNGTYKIAVIDYVALHQNLQRVYDYFPSGSVLGTLKDGGTPRLYREILADAIRNGASLNSTEYTFSNPRYNRFNLESAVSF